ncbi:MAG: tetratricopeptide repeat protein [Candidatus Marinimicrobia bacterium]|nr:tetratricopeptide repeat protein [Candidatus Neomarinimicrobiota bacterium]
MKLRFVTGGLIILFLLGSCATRELRTETAQAELPVKAPERYPTPGILHFMYGEIYRSGGNYAYANMEYLRALEYDTSITILNAIGESYMLLGKQQLATDYFEKSLQMDPRDPTARRHLINLYMQEQRYDKAIPVLQQELKNTAEDMELLRKLAEAYRKSRRYSPALEVLNTMIRLDPELPWPYLYAAELQLESEKLAEAAPYLERVIPLLPPSDDLYEFWVRALFEKQDIPAMLKALEKWIAGTPATLAPYFIYIDQRYRAGETAAGDSVLDLIRNRRDEDPRISLFEGLSAMFRDDPDEGWSHYQKAADFKESGPDIFLRFSIWFWERGEIEKAGAITETAILRFGREARWLHMLALLERERGDPEAAEQYFLEILRSDKNNRGAREDLADLYLQSGRFTEADSVYAGLLREFPDNPGVLNNYAYALAQMNLRLDEAMNMVDRALEQATNAAYLDTKAWILYQQKAYRKALRWINKALQYGSAGDEPHYHQGRILQALDREEAAVAAFQEALNQNPENREARAALEEMGKWTYP